MNIDIVIPVYNEKENIEKNLDLLSSHISGLKEFFNVVIVHDFNDDNTLPVIQEIQNKYTFPVITIRNDAGGVVNAIKKGFCESTADYILVSMADMSDDYSIIPRMVDLAKNGIDLICPSRYMKGGKLHGGPFIKQLLSRIAGISLYYLKGIPTHDITNSYKLYNREMLNSIYIESKGGFELSLEITAKAYINGYRLAEIPSQWWDRTKGKSKFKLIKWLPKYLEWYLFLLFAKKPS